jgi:type IV secretion system protein VirD4
MSEEVTGANYHLPENPGYLGGIQWQARLMGFGMALISQIFATEFLAYRMSRLGLVFSESRKYGDAGPFPIYLPLCWMKWELTYHQWLFHNMPPYSGPMVTACFVGVLGLIIGLSNGGASFNYRARRLSRNLDNLYGSSRWATRNDLGKAGLLAEQRGLLLGGWRESPDGSMDYLYDDSDRHVLVAAPTRTGKTASVGKVNALVWHGSMLVTDMKEELYQATAGWRQRTGHLCIMFAPLEPEQSIHLNPLAWIRFGSRQEIADVQKFAEGIADPGNESSESTHWNETSTALIEGLVLHEAYKARVKRNNVVTLAEISQSLSPFTESFADYLKEMASFLHDPDGKYGWKDAEGNPTKTHPIVRERAMEAVQRSEREASSVLSSAKKRFRLFADPLVREATSGCDFEIEDLVDQAKPVSLYLVLPPSEKKRLASLVRIILLMVMSRLTEKQQKRRHPLLFLLDEFPALGYMSPLEDALSFVGGYGIRCLLIVQDLSQIRKRYGQDNEIIPNCHIKITFTIADLKTAKAYSEEAGSQTVQHAAIQFSHKHKNSAQLRASSAHVQVTKRPLVEPEELMRLLMPGKVGDRVVSPGEFVMFVLGCMPIKGVQAFGFLDPTFKRWMDMKPVDESKALIKRDIVREAFAS